MPRTKTYDRQEALEKALLLFHKKGYEATGISELVKHMGISRSSIYDSFGDKEGLYKEVLKLYRSRTSDQLFQALNNTDDVASTLRLFFITGLKERCSSEPRGCLIANACTEVNILQHDDIIYIIKDNHASLADALTRAIQRGQQSGKVKENINAPQMAQLILLSNNGASIVNKVHEDIQPTLDALELVISLLDVKVDTK